mmetsp:Transcript_8039/g.16155  ORF Transcript_8039/g.16155 Transcript_8039/m.16155 type:complete len:689 (+) Transcript_8039:164-2230(+)
MNSSNSNNDGAFVVPSDSTPSGNGGKLNIVDGHVPEDPSTIRDGGRELRSMNSTLKSFRRRDIQLIELSMENITYAPITRSAGKGNKGKLANRKVVLSNVSTKISPYQLNGWLGASGAGKSSLLSVAAGLIADPENDLIQDSRICINGEEGTLPKRLIGVVWQDDLLLSNLTVKETVTFAARLKTSSDQSDEQVDNLVEEILASLGLSHIKDSLIGDPRGNGKNRGISGGERKRVAIASELVARPSLLLLDEPTSGLDATTAYQLMVTLKELATLGHAIVVVIHQPRTSIFEMFDNLLLLSQGKVVYEGVPPDAKIFLESCPDVRPLPPETNTADWIMDVISEDERKKHGDRLPKLWADFNSKKLEEGTLEQSQNLRNRLSTISTTDRSYNRRLSSLAELESEPKFHVGFVKQLMLLTSRSTRQQRGERLTRVASLMILCWIAFTGLAWGRIPDSTEYIFNRTSLLFFIIIAQSNSVVMSSMVTFASERKLLSRERAKKMYGVLPYFIAKTLADMMNSVALPVLYGSVVYWICNLRSTAAAFFTFVLTLYLTISAAQSTGLFLSIAIPNFSIALLLAPLITICLIILGGFYIPYDSISPALSWASWLSMARYGFSAFIVNEFDGRYIPCGSDDNNVSALDECPLNGSTVVASFGIEGIWTNIWVNVAVLVAIQVALRVVTYVLLLRSK